MTTRTRLAATATAAVLLLAACTPSAPAEQHGPDDAAAPAPTSASGDASGDLLADLGLDGLSGAEVVEALDASPDARPRAFSASVRPDEVLVSDGDTEVAVPLPDDVFYLSVAPYVSRTHDCFHHNLGTCQGELVDAEVHVRVVGADGAVLVDETARTYANGFVGFWVPRGSTGTVEVTHDGRTGSVPFGTTDDDPTCLTTLRLA